MFYFSIDLHPIPPLKIGTLPQQTPGQIQVPGQGHLNTSPRNPLLADISNGGVGESGMGFLSLGLPLGGGVNAAEPMSPSLALNLNNLTVNTSTRDKYKPSNLPRLNTLTLPNQFNSNNMFNKNEGEYGSNDYYQSDNDIEYNSFLENNSNHPSYYALYNIEDSSQVSILSFYFLIFFFLISFLFSLLVTFFGC